MSVKLQRVDVPVLSSSPVAAEFPRFSQDRSGRVTSNMINTPSYDHITPTPYPRTTFDLQARYCSPGQPLRIITDLHCNETTAAASAFTSPPSPREDQDVTRDDLYYALKKSAASPALAMHDPTCARSISTVKARKELQELHSKRIPSGHAIEPDMSKQTPRRKIERDFLRNIMPLTPIKPTECTVTPAPTMEQSTKHKLSPATKTITWGASLRKKSKPTEIFNLHFGFHKSSRRPADRTPDISPRSSVSFDSDLPTPPRGEPLKRQRIDSSGTDQSFYCLPDGSTKAVKTEAENDSPRISVDKPVPRTAPINIPIVKKFLEAHPGRPVDFSSPRVSSDEDSSPDDQPRCPRPRVASLDYHNHLVPSSRPGSLPSERLQFQFQDDPADPKNQAKQEKLSKESRILGLNTNLTSSRTNVCSLERKKRTSRKTPPNLNSRDSISSTATSLSRYSARSSSTMSDPSMENFLMHIRASQEARAYKEAMRHGRNEETWVFVDEMERGFWNDEPL